MGEKNTVYSVNMIAQKSNSGVISDPNKWSHSSASSKKRKTTKNNNQ